MQSTILLVAIFVAVHVNYVSSAGLQIRECQNDQDVCTNLSELGTELIPILLIKNYSEYPLSHGRDRKRVIGFFENRKIGNLLVVPANKCIETTKLLKDCTDVLIDTETDLYPSIFLINDRRLISKRWKGTHINNLKLSLKYVEEMPPPDTNTINFESKLRTEIYNSTGMYIGGADGQLATPTYRRKPTFAFDQTTLSIQPAVNTRASGQIEQSNPPTYTAQTSVSNWPTSTLQPASWPTESVGYSTAYQPTWTKTTTPVFSVGDQSIGPATTPMLDQVGTTNLPARTNLRPDEMLDQLSNMGQRQQSGRYHKSGSGSIPTQYNENNQLEATNMPARSYLRPDVMLDQMSTVSQFSTITQRKRQQQAGQYYEIGNDSPPKQYNQYNQLMDVVKSSKRTKTTYEGNSGSARSLSGSP